ncbi:MAG: cell division protein ZapA [Erythrobacter sp.]
MSTVTLTIGPKSYSIACADGEEAHIEALGAMIAEQYARLGSARAPLEAQNLLFAALFLADELAEARKGKEQAKSAPADTTAEIAALKAEIVRLQAELAAARKAPAPAPAPQGDLFGAADAQALLAGRLEALAACAEASAAALEAAVASA